jgi:hypothetical protein
MMKTTTLCRLLGAAALAATALAADASDCEALRASTADRLADHGVRSYSLQVVDEDNASSGRVVGHCDGGRRRIVYRQVLVSDVALAALLVPSTREEAGVHAHRPGRRATPDAP